MCVYVGIWVVTAEGSMVQLMCNARQFHQHGVSSLRNKLCVSGIGCRMHRSLLRWYGHITYMDYNSGVKSCQSLDIVGSCGRGKPRKT